VISRREVTRGLRTQSRIQHSCNLSERIALDIDSQQYHTS